MRSYCVNKHEATEPEYPRVLKITAPKLKLSTQLLLKMSTVRNLFFCLLKCTIAETEKRAEEFHNDCDTDPYQP